MYYIYKYRRILCIKLETNEGCTTMHGQPIIKKYLHCVQKLGNVCRRGCVVSIAHMLPVGRSGVSVPVVVKYFFFLQKSVLAMGPIRPSIQ